MKQLTKIALLFAVLITSTACDTSETTTVTPTEPPPPVSAQFAVDINGLKVSVTPASTPASAVATWGDGSESPCSFGCDHGYAGDGTYTIRYTATGDGGDTASSTRTVSVSDPGNAPEKPRADFRYSMVGDGSGLVFSFVDLSEGDIDTWDWGFSDGTGGSSERSPEHTFPAADTYSVLLEVCNEAGCDSVSKSVDVPGATQG